jgi:protein-tyrosine phosphatase
MNQILILCIGNICRSPMAEGLLKVALPHISVQSAGLGALIGRPADEMALQLMGDKGVDISNHRAQQISTTLTARADLILVMDVEQKKYVESHYIGTRGKIFRLCEADVPDPYKMGKEAFRESLSLIEKGVEFWSGQISQMR